MASLNDTIEKEGKRMNTKKKTGLYFTSEVLSRATNDATKTEKKNLNALIIHDNIM